MATPLNYEAANKATGTGPAGQAITGSFFFNTWLGKDR